MQDINSSTPLPADAPAMVDPLPTVCPAAIAVPAVVTTEGLADASAAIPGDTVTATETAPRRRPRSAGKPADKSPRADRRPRQPKPISNDELADLRRWLNGLDLGISPAVHVNGAAFTNCVLCVDFGTPRKSIRLNPDQSSELVTRLRALTKTVMARDVKVGVMTDHSAGMWWTTIS